MYLLDLSQKHFWTLIDWLISGAKLGRAEGGSICSFLKIEKNILILAKKCPDFVYFWVKFFIQNVLLRVFRRKKSKLFPYGDFFIVFLIIFVKVPYFYESSLPLKNFWLRIEFLKWADLIGLFNFDMALSNMLLIVSIDHLLY